MGRAVTNRENKAAAGEFRELVGMDFDEFTRQAHQVSAWPREIRRANRYRGAAVCGRDSLALSAAAREISASTTLRVAA